MTDGHAERQREVLQRVRAVVARHADLPVDVDDLADDDDLFAAGLTSLNVVRVVVALEEEFSAQFPDEMLSRTMLSTTGRIADAVEALQPSA